MIEAVLDYGKDGKIVSLVIKGHGLAGWGKDLVCAGVSSCFTGAMNALTDNDHKIKLLAGDSSIYVSPNCSKHDEIVLETLIIQLETIKESYPNEISLKVSGKEG